MTKLSNFGAALCLSAAMLSVPSTAGAGAIVGATEFTQILNNVQLGLSKLIQGNQYIRQGFELAEQVKSAANTLKTAELMFQNTLSLDFNDWLNVEQDLLDLYRAAGQGASLSFTLGNIDDLVRQEYGTFEEYQNSPLSNADYSAQYAKWSERNRDTIAASLRTVGLNMEQIQTEQQLMQAIRTKSESVVGQRELLQVGHELADQQVVQMQKLRALLASQTQMTAAYYAKQSSNEDNDNARQQKYYGSDDQNNNQNGNEGL